MKINEVILTEEQLEELSLKGLGQGLGKAVGAVGGGVAQVGKNIWSGMKQGFSSGKQAFAPDDEPAQGQQPSGQSQAAPSGNGQQSSTGDGSTTDTITKALSGGGNVGTGGGEIAGNNLLARARQGTAQDPNAQQQAAQEPAQQQPAQPAPAAQQTAPAGQQAAQPEAPAQQSKVGVGQINKIIPTLRTRDLTSVKKNVDATIAKKTAGKTGAEQPKTQAQQPAAAEQPAQQPNLQVQQGGKAPAGRTQGGGRQKGQLSQTPNAVKKRDARAAEKDWQNMATGTNESIEFYSNFLGKLI